MWDMRERDEQGSLLAFRLQQLTRWEWHLQEREHKRKARCGVQYRRSWGWATSETSKKKYLEGRWACIWSPGEECERVIQVRAGVSKLWPASWQPVLQIPYYQPIHLRIIYGCFLTVAAELNVCNRDHLDHKATCPFLEKYANPWVRESSAQRWYVGVYVGPEQTCGVRRTECPRNPSVKEQK